MKPLGPQSERVSMVSLTKMKRFDYENMMISKAKSFTALIGVGPNRVSVDCENLEAAKEAAVDLVTSSKLTANRGKQAMVYADSIYVGKVNSRGEWEDRTP